MKKYLNIAGNGGGGFDPDFSVTVAFNAQATNGQTYRVSMLFDGYDVPGREVFERALEQPELRNKNGEDLVRGLYGKFGVHLNNIFRCVFSNGVSCNEGYDTPEKEPARIYFKEGLATKAYSAVGANENGLRKLDSSECAALRERLKTWQPA